MTTTVPSPSPREHPPGEEVVETPVPLGAPLWLLAGVEDEDEIGRETHIWRGID
ncbi:MAG: hypothetical protein ACRDP3_16375 [Streptomyces sp.]|uniref:hypothetical protein n=1 Tax=Streptomyces sp. TaxID=1931 RepID=UPI003D6AF52E